MNWYFVYFIKSKRNNKVYVGVTSKIPSKRLQEHHLGSNSWTFQNKPFDLLYYEKYACKKDAYLREKFYKNWIWQASQVFNC